MTRKTSRLFVALIAAIAVVCGVTAAAWAASVTQPGTNPFTVPRVDNAGNPDYFTVSASGYAPGTSVFIEQCDGTDPNPAPPINWFPNDHCDAATGNAPATADASGNVTFPANSVNLRLSPFKGENPQGNLFRCNGPEDPDPNDGLPTFTDCKVRVTQNLNSSNPATDAYLTLVLPSDSANTSTTTSTSTTTTTIPPVVPTCAVGTGSLKNPPGATLKASPGLLPAASTKKTTFTAQAALTNCTNFGAFVTKYPISAAKLKITVQVPPGSTCDDIQPGFPIKTTVTITFQGLNSKGKAATAATLKTTLASYTQASSTPLAVDMVGQPVTTNKSPFLGKVTHFHLTIDEDAATRATDCAAKGGLKVLHLNNGSGTFTLS